MELQWNFIIHEVKNVRSNVLRILLHSIHCFISFIFQVPFVISGLNLDNDIILLHVRVLIQCSAVRRR